MSAVDMGGCVVAKKATAQLATAQLATATGALGALTVNQREGGRRVAR